MTAIVVPKVFGRMSREVYVWLTESSCIAITTRRAILPKERIAVEALARSYGEPDYAAPDFVTLLEEVSSASISQRGQSEGAKVALMLLKGGQAPTVKHAASVTRWVTVSGDTVLPLKDINRGSSIRLAESYIAVIERLERSSYSGYSRHY